MLKLGFVPKQELSRLLDINQQITRHFYSICEAPKREKTNEFNCDVHEMVRKLIPELDLLSVPHSCINDYFEIDLELLKSYILEFCVTELERFLTLNTNLYNWLQEGLKSNVPRRLLKSTLSSYNDELVSRLVYELETNLYCQSKLIEKLITKITMNYWHQLLK